MAISERHFLSQNIYKQDQTTPFAKPRKIIIDPDTGSFVAVAINRALNSFINFADLIWDEQNSIFYVKASDVVCSAGDIPRLSQILEEKRYFDKQRINTESGKYLGTLYDFEIDPVLGVLTQISARKKIFIFSKESVIPRKNVMIVTSKTITVEDSKNYLIYISSLFKRKVKPALNPDY